MVSGVRCDRDEQGGGLRLEATYADTGRLGYPVADATCQLAGGGRRQKFQSGYMYDVPGLGARDVMNGPVLTEYLSLGAQNGALGYPTTGISCGLSGTGCFSTFQHGAIFWSHENGAHAINTSFLSRWRANGGRTGPLGNPASDRICGLRRGGCGQTFDGGGVYWSSATDPLGRGRGARPLGRGEGRLRLTGLPHHRHDLRSPERRVRSELPGGVGALVEDTGARAIRRGYGAGGGGAASPGASAHPDDGHELRLGGEGLRATFAGGSVYWSPATGSRVVKGVIRTRWLAAGGVKSRFGYPVAEQRTITGGWSQRFQHATLTYRNGRWISRTS